MKDELKDIYNATELPEELPGVVEAALRRGERRVRSRRRSLRILSPMAAALAAFVLVLNTVPTFAAAMYEVPVLGEVCRVLTVADYHETHAASEVDVALPAIEAGEGAAPWAQEVNALIRETVEAEVAESERRAEEYYEAYIATGGDPDGFIPVRVSAGYEVYYSGGDYLSFAVIKTESGASVYSSFHYYNYDVRTGAELSLENLLGPGWPDRCAAAVERGLAALPEESRVMLWTDVDIAATARDSADFYLDGEGRVVLVFDKYSLGAGALGRLEFTV